MDRNKVINIKVDEEIKQKLQKNKIKTALSSLIGISGFALGGLAISDPNFSQEIGLLVAPLLITGSVAGVSNSLEEYKSLKESLENNSIKVRKR